MRKKSSLWSVLDTIKSYWPLLVVLGGIIGTLVSIPSRLSAAEKKVAQVISRQETIEEYIEATEEQKQLIQKSPPGWQWNETTQTYIEWKDDPRLKKK